MFAICKKRYFCEINGEEYILIHACPHRLDYMHTCFQKASILRELNIQVLLDSSKPFPTLDNLIWVWIKSGVHRKAV